MLLSVTGATAQANTLAAGAYHTVVVVPDGTVYTWGANANGQLGDGSTTVHTVPAQVPGLTGVTHVAAGSTRRSCCATTARCI
jgi:alpha-tubulin suppressor-like RCC1 family protein